MKNRPSIKIPDVGFAGSSSGVRGDDKVARRNELMVVSVDELGPKDAAELKSAFTKQLKAADSSFHAGDSFFGRFLTGSSMNHVVSLKTTV